MGFDIRSPQPKPRPEQFRLVVASLPTGTAAQSTTGCPEGTYRCTVLKNGTGDYTINFNNPFARTPVVTPTALHATAGYMATLISVSTTAVRIGCWTATGTAADPTNVHVSVDGWDTADQVG